MEGKFDILRDGELAGNAIIEKRGLYYHFSAKCKINDGEHIHLKVSCGNKVTDLGLCVPLDGAFGVETSIPIKRFESGSPEFFLGERKERIAPKEEIIETPEEKTLNMDEQPLQQITIPVVPDQPFPNLPDLDGAFLEEENGEKRIVLTQKVPAPQDSDPNPLPGSE